MSAAAEAPQPRLLSDRSTYIKFLESRLDHVSKAASDVTGMQEQMDALTASVQAMQEKMDGVARLAQLTKALAEQQLGAMEMPDEARRTEDVDSVAEERVRRVEHAVRDLQEDMAAVVDHVRSLNGAQSGQAPAPARVEVASVDEQLAKDEVARLVRRELSTLAFPDVELQIEAIVRRQLDRALRTQVQHLENKQEAVEARLLSIVETRLEGYTDVYSALEKRFSAVVERHREETEEARRAHEDKVDARLQRVQESIGGSVEEHAKAVLANVTAKQQNLRQSVAEAHQRLDSQDVCVQDLERQVEELGSIGEQVERLGSWVEDANGALAEHDKLPRLVAELEDKLEKRCWTAEQTCSRMAEDVMARTETVQTKMVAQLGHVQGELGHQLAKMRGELEAFQQSLKADVREKQAAMSIHMSQAQDAIHDLGTRLRGKVNAVLGAMSTAALTQGKSSTYAVLRADVLDEVESKIDTLQRQLARAAPVIRTVSPVENVHEEVDALREQLSAQFRTSMEGLRRTLEQRLDEVQRMQKEEKEKVVVQEEQHVEKEKEEEQEEREAPQYKLVARGRVQLQRSGLGRLRDDEDVDRLLDSMNEAEKLAEELAVSRRQRKARPARRGKKRLGGRGKRRSNT